MPKECKICANPERERIESQIVAGMSGRRIASLCGVSEASVRRHKANHLPAKLAKAEQAALVSEANGLLSEVRTLQERTASLLDKAESVGELRTALVAVKELRGNLELLAKLRGELDERPVVNLYLSTEWLEMRTAIVVALEPYSDAREAVLRAIEGVDNGKH